nr:immunoglobulin heavy chain junction region [Homo sapiens]
ADSPSPETMPRT